MIVIELTSKKDSVLQNLFVLTYKILHNCEIGKLYFFLLKYIFSRFIIIIV